jgi:hypothetical protein
MNALMQVIAKEIPSNMSDSGARETLITDTKGTQYRLVDWPRFQWAGLNGSGGCSPRMVEVYVVAKHDVVEDLERFFEGPQARRDAIEWVESQLPF